MDVKVHRWINNNEKDKITYIFNKSTINIFQDDTVDTVVEKISLYINSVDSSVNIGVIPFTWWKNRSLRFKVDSSFKSPFTYDVSVKKTVYTTNDLFDLKEVNVLFFSDYKGNSNIDILFPDNEVAWKHKTDFKALQRESAKLFEVWERGKIQENEEQLEITRAQYIGKSKLASIDVKEVFKNTHASVKTPFLQLIEDSAHIAYKLYKNHDIPREILNEWCEFVPKSTRVKAPSTVVVMFKMKDIFVKATFNSEGYIFVQYKLNADRFTAGHKISDHLVIIKQWFENILKTRVSFKDDLLNAKTTLYIPKEVNAKTCADFISSKINIFRFESKTKDIVKCAYKRSIKNNTINISDYIAARLTLGFNTNDVINDLRNTGLSDEEADMWMGQFQNHRDDDVKPKKTQLTTECMLYIECDKRYIKVKIDNSSSFQEAHNILRWLRGTLLTSIDLIPPPKSVVKPPPIPVPSPVPMPVPVPVAKEKEKSSSSSHKSENNLGDDNFEFGGGGSMITELKKADPMFYTPKYSAQCQANNNRQPVVFTEEQQRNAEALGYGNSGDDKILYGSDENHKNYYMCPRIWCPRSKIALSPKQYDDLGKKCPDGESAELLYDKEYWGRDVNKPHHIGFLSKKTKDGVCLPCCKLNPLPEDQRRECTVKQDKSAQAQAQSQAQTQTQAQTQKQSQAQASTSINTKKDVAIVARDLYVIKDPGRLPKNRYGSIPEDLHTFINPEIEYSLCENVSTMNCMFRKGFRTDSVQDTLMESISYLLGLTDKRALIKKIESELDPITYMALDDGHVLTSFLDPLPIVSIDNSNNTRKLVKEWKQWSKTQFIKKDVPYIKARMIDDKNDIHVSREVGIYKSYKNFIEYLRSNHTKNPQYMIDLLHRMGYLLVIWHREIENVNSVSAVCPHFADMDDLVNSAKLHKKIIMVLESTHDKEMYYEPLEITQRSKQGITLIPATGPVGNKVLNLLQASCNVKEKNKEHIQSYTVIDIITSFNAWMELRLRSASPFKIVGILLRPDGRVYGLMMKCKMIIVMPDEGLPVHILPELIKGVSTIKRVLYLNDLSGMTVVTEFAYEDDIQAVYKKLHDIGLGLISGDIGTSNTRTFKIQSLNSVLPLVPVAIPDTLYTYKKIHTQDEKKWFHIQNAIGKKLLTNYDSIVQPLLVKTRKERIRILMNTLQIITNPDKSKIQAVLEEIPMEYGKDAIAYWIRSIGLEEKSRKYVSTIVNETKKEWLFTQAAVENGLPAKVFEHMRGWRPKEEFAPATYLHFNPQAEQQQQTKLPSILDINSDGTTKEKLPTKWKSLSAFSILKNTNYTQMSLPELFEWLSGTISLASTFKWKQDVRNISHHTISGMLVEKESTLRIMDDPSLFNAWSMYFKVHFKKNFKTPAIMWDTELSTYDAVQRQQTWNDIRSTSNIADLIWPMDVDLLNCSKLLSISILLICYRTKYGSKSKVEVNRGGLDDQMMSSSFFRGSKDYLHRPLIILYKDGEKTHSTYFPIFMNDTFVISPLNSVPSNVLKLIDRHIAKSDI
jgi:hypothetical protein